MPAVRIRACLVLTASLLLAACFAAPDSPEIPATGAASSSVSPILTLPPPSPTAPNTAAKPPTSTATVTSDPSPTATTPPTSTVTSTPTPVPRLRFAVIGDYGLAGPGEASVAEMVIGWAPEIIITTGDNNYPDGAAETIDENIGQYYHAFISPYLGSYGEGADRNRFFPSLGNHDWTTQGAQPYRDYFSLPGNEHYYDFIWEPVHFFVLDSDTRQPDKVGRSSAQAAWLQERLAASTAAWQVVYTHYPPYSSGYAGDTDWIQWPFAAWGADAVLAGHDHNYERLFVDGIPFFVNGLGGGPIYPLGGIHPASQVRYNQNHGAMLVEASPDQVTFQFYAVPGALIDTYTLVSPDEP